MSRYGAKRGYQDASQAESYDRLRFRSLRGKVGDWLDKRAISIALRSVPSGSYVLDIPCGTGRITELLLQKGYKVVGADVSREMLRVASKKLRSYANLEGLYQVDAEKLPFEDRQFDCLIAIRFMGHIPGDVRLCMLKEFRRVSRSYVIADYSVTSLTAHLRKEVERRLKIGHRFPQRWAWAILSKRELREEINSAGLRLVRVIPKLRYLSDSQILLLSVESPGRFGPDHPIPFR